MRYDETQITSVHAYIVYDIVYDIVRLTYDIVRQNTVLASRTCNVVYDVVYDIVCFFDDIVRTTYDIAKKRTISYVFTRFLPVVRAMSYTMSYTTSYVFWTTSYVQRTISPKNVRYRTFLPVSCHFDVRHRIRHRTFFDDVAYDVQCNIGIIRYRT